MPSLWCTAGKVLLAKEPDKLGDVHWKPAHCKKNYDGKKHFQDFLSGFVRSLLVFGSLITRYFSYPKFVNDAAVQN